MSNGITKILAIESGTEICSVGVAYNGQIVALRESNVGRDHAKSVAQFAHEVLEECALEVKDLDAVAVGKGPGSYTGLRIGVSVAKGLCFGAGVPLIGVGSLESLAQVALESVAEGEDGVIEEGDTLVPMVDARRMEVYAQLFSSDGVAEGDVEAVVVDEESFKGVESLVIFGDGAAKCREVLPRAKYIDVAASAIGVAKVAQEKLQRGETEDVAYFEPFYLKEVVVTKSNKRLF
ncbi:MAG: tRNA (adenosine(37)-N6)-threonylcarbamoyltransferase complex dimerization subunit type 1 TsaB [Rikenellaceae bacterium]